MLDECRERGVALGLAARSIPPRGAHTLHYAAGPQRLPRGAAVGSRHALPWPVPIDLHTHSTASDGTEAPADVVTAARRPGSTSVALTDHDTAHGWGEAAEAAARHGIGLVRGIEISCSRYGIASTCSATSSTPTTRACAAELGHARAAGSPGCGGWSSRWRPTASPSRSSRSSRRCRRAPPRAGPTSPTRSSTAARREPRRGVRRWLGNDSPYYVRHYAPDPVRRGSAGREAGGVPVIAHPFATARSERRATRSSRRWPPPGSAGSRSTTATTTARERHTARAGRAAGPARHRLERLPRRRQGEPARREHHGPRGARRDRGAGDQRRARWCEPRTSRCATIFVSAFVTLIVIMDPPGAVPIFLALTAWLTRSSGPRGASGLAGGVRGDRALRRVRAAHPRLPARLAAALQGAGGLLLLLVALQLLTG